MKLLLEVIWSERLQGVNYTDTVRLVTFYKAMVVFKLFRRISKACLSQELHLSCGINVKDIEVGWVTRGWRP